MIRSFIGALAVTLALPSLARCENHSELPANYVAGKLVVLTDNGAWSWFSDPRAIIDCDKLIVSSVRAKTPNSSDNSAAGNIEVSSLDLATGSAAHAVLHERLEQDDQTARR